jgi:hypothetical protein
VWASTGIVSAKVVIARTKIRSFIGALIRVRVSRWAEQLLTADLVIGDRLRTGGRSQPIDEFVA